MYLKSNTPYGTRFVLYGTDIGPSGRRGLTAYNNRWRYVFDEEIATRIIFGTVLGQRYEGPIRSLAVALDDTPDTLWIPPPSFRYFYIAGRRWSQVESSTQILGQSTVYKIHAVATEISIPPANHENRETARLLRESLRSSGTIVHET